MDKYDKIYNIITIQKANKIVTNLISNVIRNTHTRNNLLLNIF